MQLIVELRKLKKAVSKVSRPTDEKTLELITKAGSTENNELAKYFYPNNRNAANNFARLKSRAIEQLTNEICGSSPNGSRQLKAISSVTRNFYLLKLMAATGIRGAFGKLGQKTFKEARKYHLTDLSIVVCKELIMHYLILEIDLKLYQYFKEQYQQLLKIKELEVNAEMHLFEVYHQLTRSKHIDLDLLSKIRNHLFKLEGEKPVSYWHGYLRYNLEVIYREASGHKNDLLSVCQKALAYFNQLDFEAPPNVVRSFTFRTVPLLILARDFEAATAAIQKTKSMSKTGSHNWIAIHQYECVLGFYSKNYVLCYKAIELATKHTKELSESWLIYKAYLYLFHHLGKHKENRFRLGKFLNEVPTYSKDKKGMNINILIIQILVLLKDRRWPAIVDRIDALKAYTYRHLKNESTFRSDTFLSMLAVLPKAAFQRDQVEVKTKDLLMQLQESPILSVDFEIVPYEDLWEFVLELLI